MTEPPRAIECLRGHSAVPFVPRLPGSKSYTNRALLLAAMRPGTTAIVGGLHCDDSQQLAAALGAFGGLRVAATGDGFVTERVTGELLAPSRALDVGGGGTPARLLLAFAVAARGATVVTGNARLCERPMGGLLMALRRLGIRCETLLRDECLPVRIHGGLPSARNWRVDAGDSSQFASALLLLASQCPGESIAIELHGAPTSRPYVAMTRALMAQCGIGTDDHGDRIVVRPALPRCERIVVEPDATAMGYFLALAAATGTSVEIAGVSPDSAQGDLGLALALQQMGCRIEWRGEKLCCIGGPLRGIDIDMASMPDSVLTLAVLACLANGPTRVRNVAALRHKESDRIDAIATELTRLGQLVEVGPDWLAITPRPLRSGCIATRGDHRVAMAFSILGRVQPGIAIDDPACVTKSFPGYWGEFDRFGAHHDGRR